MQIGSYTVTAKGYSTQLARCMEYHSIHVVLSVWSPPRTESYFRLIIHLFHGTALDSRATRNLQTGRHCPILTQEEIIKPSFISTGIKQKLAYCGTSINMRVSAFHMNNIWQNSHYLLLHNTHIAPTP
mgnify:CR=1 FL=1